VSELSYRETEAVEEGQGRCGR